MNNKLEISTDELKILFNQIICHIEKKGYNIITLTKDYFWDIDADVKYKTEFADDLNKIVDYIDLGQLTFDWNDLKSLLNEPEDTIGYALVWLSHIISAIGEQIVD